MTNRTTTKKALVNSVLSFVICLTMLIGTTFAWFTDTVTSANNKIQSGTLKIDLLVKDDAGVYQSIKDSKEPIFNSSLWEPGYTEYVNVKVANIGSLALKYTLKVVPKASVSILADAIDVYFIDGEVTPTRESLASLTPVGTLREVVESTVSDAYVYGELLANDEAYATIALKMRETAGNEYQDLTFGEFDINLIATQLTSESDSFDNQYDKDAVYYDTLVTTADELYAAVAAASENTVIAIDGNITLTKALSKSGLKGIKFVAFNDDATIDQATYNMHFQGANVTFEGLTLTHGEKAYGNGGQTSTAFAVWDAKEVSYLNCTFNRSVGTIHAATHNFIGCTFNGVENPDNSKSEYPLYICDGKNYNVTDCVFNCTNRGAILFYNDGGTGVDTLNISNTKFFGDIIADKAAVEIHNNSNDQVYNVNIKDVIVGDGIINGLYRIKPAYVGEVNVNVDGKTDVATASNANELTRAISNANDGETIYLDADVNSVSDQLKIEKPVTIDLNGNELTTANNYGGTTIKNGASIKNGTITHTGNTAALKVGGEISSIENVTINVTPTTGKTKTGIQVYNGKHVKEIKNVTITGTTQGIEVAKGSRVDLIENVTVKAVADGAKKGVALLVNAASVGKAINCTFEGDYGVHMMLNGEFQVGLELVKCNLKGSTAALIAHDEAGISNTTNCSLTLTYDADTAMHGDFVWEFEDECKGVVTLNRP